jgi:hypothetical protein
MSEIEEIKIFYCEYCKNKFNNNSNLLKHQRVTKYCLIKQGKIENEKEKKREEREEKEKMEKEKIMKEKEKKRENKFRCEYCNVKFTTRVNYCGHLDICLEKYKYIINEKEKMIEEREKEKEKIIEENKLEIIKLKNKWRVKKEKLMGGRSAASTINNINTVNTNTKIKIVLHAVDMDPANIRQLCVMYCIEDFVRGARGTAAYIKNNIMTNLITGEPTAVCTDIARKIFYVNMNGKKIKDPNLNTFYDSIEHIIDLEINKTYNMLTSDIKFGDIHNEIFMQMKKEAVNRSKVIQKIAELSYLSCNLSIDLLKEGPSMEEYNPAVNQNFS